MAAAASAATLFIGYHAVSWMAAIKEAGEPLAIIAAGFTGLFFLAFALIVFLIIAPFKRCEPWEGGQEKDDEVFKSSSPKFFGPKDLFIFLMDKFDAEGGGFITFQYQGNTEFFVQVTLEEPSTNLNFFYPFNEDPDKLFREHRIKLPGGYELSDWSGGNYAMYNGPRKSHTKTADVVDAIFKKLLGVPTNYVVIGWID